MRHRLGFLPLILFAFVALVGLPATASATPVLWTLNVTKGFFGNPVGTVVGSFVYDADTNQYSSVAITMTSPAASFDTSDLGGALFGPNSASKLQLIFNFVPGANLGKTALVLRFGGVMTNLGGSLILSSLSAAGICESGSCDAFDPGFGDISGNVTGTPVASSVPEPATLVLFSAGVLGVGVRRWRQWRA
jgi:hypothetical protein